MLLFTEILAIWNVIVMLVYGIDKLKAKKGSHRISEKRLIMLALFMGALGALCGMYLFRHKTLKPKFKFGVPVLLILNGVIIYGLVKYFFV